MLDRIGDGFRPAGELQLGEDAADVGFHGGDADEQCLSDLLVAIPLHDQVQYFPLTFRQIEGRLFRWAGGLN